MTPDESVYTCESGVVTDREENESGALRTVALAPDTYGWALHVALTLSLILCSK